MSNVKVTELKLVEFQSGYLRALRGNDARHIAWVRNYTMVVPKRGGVRFAEGNYTDGVGDIGLPFPRAVLRRSLREILALEPHTGMADTRSGIEARRIGASRAYELHMPCGETACLRESVVKRLLKELS